MWWTEKWLPLAAFRCRQWSSTYIHVVHPRRNGKLGITRGWPIDDTGAMMAAASMEAVIKKMPMEWGQIIGSGQFKRRIGDDDQMSSLFKSVAENKEVLKRPFKATAKKAKKTPEEKKLKRKRKESYAREIHGVVQHTWPGTGVSTRLSTTSVRGFLINIVHSLLVHFVYQLSWSIYHFKVDAFICLIYQVYRL